MPALAKTYSDDEYYTSEETAVQFFEKVVKPSGILKHKTLLMPFTGKDAPLHRVAERYHNHIIYFEDDKTLWERAATFEDAAVIDNPPFSLSVQIESRYIEEGIPFVLFRSAVSYPKFLFKAENAGIIYENNRFKGVEFEWGFAHHIAQDEHIKKHYPNLLHNLKHHGILAKRVPIGFSFYLTDYDFKIKTVAFGELVYPRKADQFVYLNTGVFDETTKIYIDEEDGRVHAFSAIREETEANELQDS